MRPHWLQMLLPMTPFLVWVAAFGGGFTLLARNRLFFFPRHFKLRKQGIDLLMCGQPAEAEKCFREALQLGSVVPAEDRVRLMVCLGDALVDQGRYQEAQELFERSLALGDPTGSCQMSICDLLLLMKTDSQRALEMAEIATKLSVERADVHPMGTKWISASRILKESRGLARKAHALALLGRQDEARTSIEQALKITNDHREQISKANPEGPFLGRLAIGRVGLRDMKFHQIAETHWQIGLALLALGDKHRAAREFRIVSESDAGGGARGRYRLLAGEKLASLANEFA